MPRPPNRVTLAAILGILAQGQAVASAQVGTTSGVPGTTTSGVASHATHAPCPPTVIHYAPTVSFVPGPFGLIPWAPPLIVAAGPVSPIVAVPPGPILVGVAPIPTPPPTPIGLFAPPPPIDPLAIAAGQGGLDPDALPPRRGPANEGRMLELMTFGDRNFRAGDLRRAERRYQQAMAAAPLSAEPRARLAVVAFARAQYDESANLLREAITADPSWLDVAIDVQSLFAEPADFHAPLSALESHLQANPGDRDGWLVLGAQLYLSGRVERSADIFLRLADRRPDAALAALIAVSGAGR